ncbi:MAG: SWIM zinc finger family protein [Gemmatales bacterium]
MSPSVAFADAVSPTLRKLATLWPKLSPRHRQAILAVVDDHRRYAGMELAATRPIVRTERGWQVHSQAGDAVYTVRLDETPPRCSCSDSLARKLKCKHIWAAEMARGRESALQ